MYLLFKFNNKFDNKSKFNFEKVYFFKLNFFFNNTFFLFRFINEKVRPVVLTEEQLLFVCHLVGPFLQRFNTDRPRCIMELTQQLYELLEQVDKAQPHLTYMDPICDLLYHIKYMFVGDMMKIELQSIIRRLRPALQMRLRFITHLNVETIGVSPIATISGTNGSVTNAGSIPTAVPGVGVVPVVPMDVTQTTPQ